jgi:hypothetical protein
MRFRKLRIAWSVGWGLAVVLLIVLWVRTNYAIENFGGPLPGSAGFGISSRHGGVGVLLSDRTWGWSYSQHPTQSISESEVDAELQYNTMLGFIRYKSGPGEFRIRVPYWSAILVAAVFTGLTWVPWRFSLRTLLIATTLVAVVLGLVVWATNSVEMNTLGGPSKIVNEHGRLIEK